VSGSLGGLQLPKICLIFTLRCIARAKVEACTIELLLLPDPSQQLILNSAAHVAGMRICPNAVFVTGLNRNSPNSGLLAGQVQKPSECYSSPGSPSSACH